MLQCMSLSKHYFLTKLTWASKRLASLLHHVVNLKYISNTGLEHSLSGVWATHRTCQSITKAQSVVYVRVPEGQMAQNELATSAPQPPELPGHGSAQRSSALDPKLCQDGRRQLQPTWTDVASKGMEFSSHFNFILIRFGSDVMHQCHQKIQ